LYLIGNERKLLIMQDEEANRPRRLMPVSPEGIPRALSKAETYRFLNEPWQAESICRDVLAIDPGNQSALILLVLSLTDQFEHGVTAKEVLQIAASLVNEYHRAYYSGIIHERQAITEFRRHPDWRSRRQAHILFQNAMESYQQARAIRPPDNDDASLRWNACVRFLERNWELQ
jgi:hypothetical protein